MSELYDELRCEDLRRLLSTPSLHLFINFVLVKRGKSILFSIYGSIMDHCENYMCNYIGMA